MPSPSEMRYDFEQVLNENGTSIQISNYSLTYSGLYGEVYLQSGTKTSSTVLGLFLPITAQDVQFLPQGQVSLFPRRLFVHGSVSIGATSRVVANGSEYAVIPSMGIVNFEISGTVIYNRCYVRALVGSEYEFNG